MIIASPKEFIIQTPTLWSPDMPALYSAETRLYEGDQLKDLYDPIRYPFDRDHSE